MPVAPVAAHRAEAGGDDSGAGRPTPAKDGGDAEDGDRRHGRDARGPAAWRAWLAQRHRGVLAGIAIVFVLAMLTITAIELVAQRPLSGVTGDDSSGMTSIGGLFDGSSSDDDEPPATTTSTTVGSTLTTEAGGDTPAPPAEGDDSPSTTVASDGNSFEGPTTTTTSGSSTSTTTAETTVPGGASASAGE